MDKKLFFTQTLLILLLAIFYFLYLLFSPFIPSLLWAGMIAIMFMPWYNKLNSKLNHRENLTSLLMCLLITFFVLLPLLMLCFLVIKEFIEGTQYITKWLENFELKDVLKWPWVMSGIELASKYIDLDTINLKEAFINSVEHISQIGINLSTRFFLAFSNFFITLALVEFNLFFFFRDGKRFINFLKSLIPIEEKSKDLLIHRMKEVTQTSIYGSVATAGANGLLGGIAFAFLGLPSPVLWGVLMALLSFVPVVGPILIWAPASIYLIMQSHPVKAIVLILWCVVLMMGVADYMVRPILINKISSEDTQLNTLILFLSIMGGIQLFGILGIVLGPFIVVVALTLLELWKAAGGLSLKTGSLDPTIAPVKMKVISQNQESQIELK